MTDKQTANKQPQKTNKEIVESGELVDYTATANQKPSVNNGNGIGINDTSDTDKQTDDAIEKGQEEHDNAQKDLNDEKSGKKK